MSQMEHPAISATRAWVDEIVIGYNFCPFARFVRDAAQIHFVVLKNDDAGTLISQLHDEYVRLDKHPEIATTLIVLSTGADDFADYLDLLALAEHFTAQWGYQGEYQLASFHPSYTFEGEEETSASHYTNRSPYPTFHLIREGDITRAKLESDDTDLIVQRNIQKTHELGCPHFDALLQRIKENTTKG